MCPRCEGLGTVSDLDPAQLFDAEKSIAEGALTVPGWSLESAFTAGAYRDSGVLDPN
jgi:excinuclease UvrABC ATPase subunit